MTKKPYFRPKLLIISDVAHMRAWLKKHLEDSFDIIIETRISTAIQAAYNIELDFIFLDESIKDCEPIDLCEKLKQVTHKYQTLIYVITGKLKKKYIQSLKNAGVFEVLHSMQNNEELTEKVQKGISLHERQRKTSNLFSALKMPNDLPNQELKNRFIKSYQATMEIAEAKVKESPLQLIMVKIDKFADLDTKTENTKSETVSNQVSKSIQEKLRQKDILIPTSKDKFVVIMPDTEKNSANEFAKKIQKFHFSTF